MGVSRGDKQMSRGISSVSIDEKGRIKMPARYCEQLRVDDKCIVVLTIDTHERCLLLYALPDWEVIEAKLANLPSFNPVARRIQRFLIGHAIDVEMDKQGRILVPTALRDYANLKKNAFVVGQGKKLEIWDEQHWADSRSRWLEEEASNNNAELPDEVKSISL